MKKLIISVVLSIPLFFLTTASFSSSFALYNPEQRINSMSIYNGTPKIGADYAYYWHRGGWRWHRWHYWPHWHYWHHWYY